MSLVGAPYAGAVLQAQLRVAYQNKAPVGAYRGVGQPVACAITETLMDAGAAALGLDPAELRRRNLVQPEQMPYSVGFIYRDGKPVRYDSGDYPACQAIALAAIDWQGFAQRKAAARAEGRLLGIALANYVEGTGLGPFEGATVRVQQTGRVSIFTGASAQGQGHKTTLAQIIAGELGVGFRATSGPVIAKAGDLAALLTAWGSGGISDLDGDGTTGAADLAILLSAWGACP